MKCYLSCLIGLTLLFINSIHARVIDDLSNADKEVHGDDYYLIYVNNEHGEYRVFPNESTLQKRQDSQIFIDSLVDKISALIIDNKDTYDDPEKLLEIEETAQLRKREVDANSVTPGAVYPISSVENTVVLFAYLSEKLSKEIPKVIENVIEVTPNTITAKLYHKNYNATEILAETGWKDLSVREDADFHLSLLSQGKYDKESGFPYDNNYYYPATAGKGVDIIVLDSSFHFSYDEFSNTEDRIVKCAGNVVNGAVSTKDTDHYCGESTIYHGEVVSVSAAGLTHGVANRANIYGVSLPTTEEGGMSGADILGGLQYIYENLIRPNKTVVNLSLGGVNFRYSSYYSQFNSVVNSITKNGGIVVVAAGNDGYNLDKDIPFYNAQIPCQFENTICVGATNNVKTGTKFDNYYALSFFSNFGKDVEIYAPSFVNVNILKNNELTKEAEAGTSFSSPIVAGLIATIIAERDDIQFTKKTIVEYLLKNGQLEPFTLENGATGYLANNDKHSIYPGEDNHPDNEDIRECLAAYLGYPCCSHCDVSRNIKDLKIGQENNEVCGIKFTCEEL